MIAGHKILVGHDLREIEAADTVDMEAKLVEVLPAEPDTRGEAAHEPGSRDSRGCFQLFILRLFCLSKQNIDVDN